MTKVIKWIWSEGGPLVCIPKTKAKQWGGSIMRNFDEKSIFSQPKHFMDPKLTYYGEICEKESGLINTVFIDEIPVIVLGDVPSNTSCLPISANEILFVRWDSAESDETLHQISTHMSSIVWEKEFELNITEQCWCLFDSAAVFQNLMNNQFLEVIFERDCYSVFSGYFCLNERDSFLIHRFCKKRT